MWGLYLFVFLTILQGVFLQPPPPCGPPPHENPLECCKIPQLFTDEDRSECGIDGTEDRTIHPDCPKITCMYKKNKLMKDDTTVDKDALGAFMDKFVETNADYKEAVEKAKDLCLKNDIPMGRKLCEPARITGCLFFVTFENCPSWEKNDKCDKLKEYFEKCKEIKGIN